jgi:hypothetical protein
MKVIIISWYLCMLFFVALLAESAVTVAPGGESLQKAIIAVLAVLLIGSGAMALAFMRWGVPQTRWLPKVLLGAACGSTLMVLLFVVG